MRERAIREIAIVEEKAIREIAIVEEKATREMAKVRSNFAQFPLIFYPSA